MKTKRLLAVSSAVAVAVSGTAICFSPKTEVKAHAADFGDLGSAVDYILTAEGSTARELTSSPVASWLVLCQIIANTPDAFAPGVSTGLQFDTISGTYISGNDGKEHFISAYAFSSDQGTWYNGTGSSVSYPLLVSDEISVWSEVPDSREFHPFFGAEADGSVVHIGTGNPGGSVVGSGSLLSGTLGYIGFYEARKISPVYANSPPTITSDISGGYLRAASSSYSTLPIMYSADQKSYTMPGSSDLIYADPNGFVQDVVRPIVETTYPEYIYLLPDKPYEPEYPTDFVTGIPKDWTITNPQLPTMPDLTLDIPDATLPSMDVSSELGQYTDGVRFWWALTGWVMDTLGIKTLVIVFLIIGIAVFALFKIGG